MSTQARQLGATVANFQQNHTVPKKLGVGVGYKELHLRIEGQLSCDAADNTTGNLDRRGALAAVPQVQIKKNTSRPRHTWRTEELLAFNRLFMKGDTKVQSDLGNGDADPSFSEHLILPFTATNMAKPLDSFEDTRGDDYNNLHAYISFGEAADILPGASNSVDWANEPTVYIYEKTFQNSQMRPRFERTVTRQHDSVTTTTSNFEIDLADDVGYRGFLLNTIVDGADNPNVIQNLAFGTKSNDFIDRTPYNVLLHDFRTRYNVTVPETFRRSDDADFDAYLPIQIPTDGRYGEAINATDLNQELKLQMSVDASLGSEVEIRVVELKFNEDPYNAYEGSVSRGPQ